jgi:hypothetical protein
MRGRGRQRDTNTRAAWHCKCSEVEGLHPSSYD